ncbi:MAG: hypothetical protein RIQ50_1650, partial [Bacteroidota bacterium]
SSDDCAFTDLNEHTMEHADKRVRITFMALLLFAIYAI